MLIERSSKEGLFAAEVSPRTSYLGFCDRKVERWEWIGKCKFNLSSAHTRFTEQIVAVLKPFDANFLWMLLVFSGSSLPRAGVQ